MMDYSACCIKSESCGPHLRSRTTGVFKVNELSDDVNNHLVYLKLQHHYKKTTDLNEKSLIENRMGYTFQDVDVICAFHRKTLGIAWKPSKCCQHPSHASILQKKAPPVRSVPLARLKMLTSETGTIFPIGTVFCFKHLKDPTEECSQNGCDSTAVKEIDQNGCDDAGDVDYEPEIISQSEESLNMAEEASMSICGLDTSPLSFQIKRKRVDDSSSNTKKTLLAKYEKVKKQLKLRFAEAAAPGQVEEFIKKVLNSSDEEDNSDDDIPDDLVEFLRLYPDSDSISKMIILSLIDHNKYSKNEIMAFFGCSRYKIDHARSWKAKNQGNLVPEKVRFTRNRLNIIKVEHFLDFVFSSGLLQDVSYGVHKIKFDSGTKETIPKAILTTRYSHAIGFYKQNSLKNQYEPLSDSTLWGILKAIKPSQRKSLAGLDDISAAGICRCPLG